jgi:hypothetical protein
LDIYCDTTKDEFYVKKSKKVERYTPIKWKHLCRKYKVEGNEKKQKTYSYIHFYNPETKEKIRISDDQWLGDKKNVLKQNKQKENKADRLIYSEILKSILKIISENISENTSETIAKNVSEEQPDY